MTENNKDFIVNYEKDFNKWLESLDESVSWQVKDAWRD